MGKLKAGAIIASNKHRRDVRTQFGALCWRKRADKVEILLVTSRRSGRWIIPKGWPMPEETPPGAAATEAFEEAGVQGKIGQQPIGIYTYRKIDVGKYKELPCVVAVFPMKVKKVYSTYPEAEERRRKWVSRKKAAKMVDEPELKAILSSFDPLAA